MSFNKGICPLCGQPNGCAFQMGMSHEKCWCEDVKVPKELIERVPAQLQGKVCICRNCVTEFLEEQK